MKTVHTTRILLWTPIILIGYFISAQIGFNIAFLNSQVSPVWPPEGVALSSLLLLGPAALPGIYLGATLANFYNNPHFQTAFIIGIGNTLSSYVNYRIIKRVTEKTDPLYSTKDLIYFLSIGTFPGSFLSAVMGVTSLWYWDFLSSELYFNVFFTWFSGEMLGFLIVAPLLYVWFYPKTKLNLELSKQLELFLWLIIVYISGSIAFSDEWPLLFVPIPFVIVTSIRFRQFGATLSTVVLSYIAVTLTIEGKGVFARRDASGLSINDSLIFLDAFLFCISGIAYFLVTATRERERAQETSLKSLQVLNELKEKANEELELKVLERTAVIEEQRIEIEKQLDMAKRIQESLFPQKEIIPNGVEIEFKNIPMMKVGGDLYDIVWRPEKQELGVFICDVSGHGIPAALLSALVKTSLEKWKEDPSDLKENLESIRNQIMPNLREHFVTASLLHLQTDTGVLTFARAGHFPLFIIRKSGALVSLKPMGRIITPIFDILAEEEKFQLEKGDLIVMLTDGLTEAREPSTLQMFGEDKLLRLVTDLRNKPLLTIRDEVFQSVIHLSGGIRAIQDDLTLGLIRYTGINEEDTTKV
ncbi:serine/threonine protein phosphatase [Leptospira levettii]|uniref:PP2C family protein-serine/threonine phosphatase n=1 Tax=Leptospira levettii TaxID=2023178 RepID=UPI000C2B19C7|nr:SpoIIE family protein phosphatase [Leptospira levettii]PKA28261.1 serine/threonine protein phosphatase [Leptospira sp. mixed culture ATI2-C-A1]MCW7495158.1 SpoIIE family protein phosphatase [Leptospira levettii]MCW7507998.1 SpoIIE family protein phosphatase [Leptospira levettii]MCW7519088.1 SpoIIE family protein phosphatase [Leptospira levettii]TGK98575.1 serine/threonine protein phosphatase [Leptospira levettii]